MERMCLDACFPGDGGPAHVLLISGFSPTMKAKDLEDLVRPHSGQGGSIHWIDNTSVAAVFHTPALARQALAGIRDPRFKVHEYSEAGAGIGGHVISYSVVARPMTSLSEAEARVFFLQRAAPQRRLETLSSEEQEILRKCVGRCCFSFEDGNPYYHPLALRALAEYYHTIDELNLLTWREHHEGHDKLKLSNASSSSDARSDIFHILELQFTTLALREKLLFMDLSCYVRASHIPGIDCGGVPDLLADILQVTATDLEFQLEGLKKSGIISITLTESGEQSLTVHDLYKEFAKWYVPDGEGSRCPELGCVYHTESTDSLPNVLKRTSPSAHQLQRIHLANLKCASFPSQDVQEWCKVAVLHIHGCSSLKELNLHGLRSLRLLNLSRLEKLETILFSEQQAVESTGSTNGALESLQHVGLIDLGSLKRLPDFSLCTLLKSFHMQWCSKLLPEPPSLMGCSRLETLYMEWNAQWQVEAFNLVTFTSLTSLEISETTGASFSDNDYHYTMGEYSHPFTDAYSQLVDDFDYPFHDSLHEDDGIPPTNVVFPHSDDVISHSDGVFPHSDDVIPHSDGVLPHSDDVIPHSDGVFHLSDDVSPHSDDVIPHSDGVFAHSDDVIPHSDGVLPHSDDVISHSDDVFHLSDDVSPHSDYIYPDVFPHTFPKKEVKLVGLEACTQLQRLKLYGLPITSLIGLENLTKVEELSVTDCYDLREIPDVSALVHLQELGLPYSKITRIPGVESLLQLRSLNCSNCLQLTALPDLDHLPNLQHVNLYNHKYVRIAVPRVPPHCRVDAWGQEYAVDAYGDDAADDAADDADGSDSLAEAAFGYGVERLAIA